MKNNFFKDFMDGFTSKIEFEVKKDTSPEEYLIKSFSLIENNFKKMSKDNETKEKLFYKK